ncbi:hypothetical protein HDE_09158 [Halotydeus destructor]|nr:hypothetical protein HDE_09158 [Halotydeus destructor]
MAQICLLLLSLISLLAVSNGYKCTETPADVVMQDDKIRVFYGEYEDLVKPKLTNGRAPLIRKQENADKLVLEFREIILAAYQDGVFMHYYTLRSSKIYKELYQNGKRVNSTLVTKIRSVGKVSSVKAATSTNSDDRGSTVVFFEANESEYQWTQTSGGAHKVNNLGKIKNGARLNPSAITDYRRVGTDQQFLVFYGQLFTVTSFDFGQGQPLKFSGALDFQLAREWAGCAAELCFDSRFDFAYQHRDAIMVGGSIYEWAVNLTTRAFSTRPLPHLVEALEVIRAGNGSILIEESKVVPASGVTVKSAKFEEVFQGTQITRVDAAFRMISADKLVHALTSGTDIELFEMTQLPDGATVEFKLICRTTLEDVFPGSQLRDLDCGSLTAANDTTYLFRGNFFYIFDPKVNTPLEAKLIQGNLFECKDSYYAASRESKLLNISNYQDFVNYRNQFLPKTTTLSPATVSGDSSDSGDPSDPNSGSGDSGATSSAGGTGEPESSPGSTQADASGSSSRGVVIALILIAVLIAAGLVYCLKFRKAAILTPQRADSETMSAIQDVPTGQ